MAGSPAWPHKEPPLCHARPGSALHAQPRGRGSSLSSTRTSKGSPAVGERGGRLLREVLPGRASTPALPIDGQRGKVTRAACVASKALSPREAPGTEQGRPRAVCPPPPALLGRPSVQPGPSRWPRHRAILRAEQTQGFRAPGRPGGAPRASLLRASSVPRDHRAAARALLPAPLHMPTCTFTQYTHTLPRTQVCTRDPAEPCPGGLVLVFLGTLALEFSCPAAETT